MRGLLRLTRFPLVWTAVADSAAGYLVAADAPRAAPMIGVAAVSAMLYALGMVLNDLADLERDRTLHPDRSLVSGQVSQAAAWTLVAALMVAALAVAASLGGATLSVAGLLLLAILAYDLLLKRLDVLGALGMGTARGLNFLLGAAPTVAAADFPWHGHAVALFCYVAAVTGVSLFEESPRRGWLAAYGGLAVAAAGAVAYAAALQGAPWGAVAASVAGAVLLARLGPCLRAPERSTIMRFVRDAILMIILLDAAAAMTGPLGAAAGLGLLGLLPMALLARRILGPGP